MSKLRKFINTSWTETTILTNTFFSEWEYWDYELTTFKEILTDDQIKTYEKFVKENIERYEQSLIDQDKDRSNEIACHGALVNYYETQFLPELEKDPFLRFGWLSADKTKIEYLKEEYKRFLNDTKKAILTSHFRHNRKFKPTELKVSLLRRKLSCLIPDYSSFKHQMDEPTKAITDYLKSKIRKFPDKTEELLTRKLAESKEFSAANFKKHYGDIQGWHVILEPLTAEDEREDGIMSLLLFDKEKYGYLS